MLVVDDNAANRALAQATLEDEGYRVVLAAGGVAGIEAFTREHPDCILLDVRMPDLDGPAACREIRALPGGADVPIVFVTAQRDVETFDRALHSGGDDYMTKPFRPNELVARVQAALKLRRLATERTELYAQVKRQRDELQRLQLEREQLMSFLVHDLKNPVNAIELHAELVLRDKQGTDRSRRAADKIKDEGRSLLRMITALLDIARADEGRLAPARTRLGLASLVGEVVGAFQVKAQAAGVEIVHDVRAQVLDADGDLVRRILENLVENAIRHAPEGTVVQVATARANGGVELSVRDAGPGVPADQRERVFERFVQAAPGATRTNHGLGLTFCKLAAEAHGGRIWIDDAAPGATFTVWIEHAD
ncbi:MAG: hybrid sensor histidine kinase/response regulator [Deltaproteobacteria bacterium]|nr:hybrid sensor histidine kinase/response regulator [Deltaproteobacteria bacterium]